MRRFARRCRRLLRKEFDGSQADGWLLYGANVGLEAMLGAPVRWLLVYFGTGALPPAVPLPPPAALAWVCALAPFAWSTLALVAPVGGAPWRRAGAHLATKDERACLMAAMVGLWQVDWEAREPERWYVLDDPQPVAMTHGRDVLVTTGLMRHRALPALIAHELGHAHSVDTRLTGAAAALVVWRRRRQRGSAETEPFLPLFSAIHTVFGIAGGCVSARLVDSRRHGYRCAREYAADAYAASLGQARPLIRFFTAMEQSPDAGALRLLTALSDHPPPRSRIARLHEYVVANYPIRPRPL